MTTKIPWTFAIGVFAGAIMALVFLAISLQIVPEANATSSSSQMRRLIEQERRQANALEDIARELKRWRGCSFSP